MFQLTFFSRSLTQIKVQTFSRILEQRPSQVFDSLSQGHWNALLTRFCSVPSRSCETILFRCNKRQTDTDIGFFDPTNLVTNFFFLSLSRILQQWQWPVPHMVMATGKWIVMIRSHPAFTCSADKLVFRCMCQIVVYQYRLLLLNACLHLILYVSPLRTVLLSDEAWFLTFLHLQHSCNTPMNLFSRFPRYETKNDILRLQVPGVLFVVCSTALFSSLSAFPQLISTSSIHGSCSSYPQ